MSNDHAEMFKKQRTCPTCSHIPESFFSDGTVCPTCGRRESLFLKAFGIHEPTEKEEDDFTIHSLKLRLADMAERHDAHKANYEYMAKRCAEQQKEIEALKAQGDLGSKRIDPRDMYKPAEVEPVAWMTEDGLEFCLKMHVKATGDCFPCEGPWVPLYTTPPNHRAAMELALNALGYAYDACYSEAAFNTVNSAITSLRTALGEKE